MPFRPPETTLFRTQRDEKPWGHETLWAWGPTYVGKILHLRAGASLSLQYHERKDETLSVLSGTVVLVHGTDASALEETELRPGDCFRVRPGTIHRLTAREESDLLEASTTELDDVVRLKDDYGRA